MPRKPLTAAEDKPALVPPPPRGLGHEQYAFIPSFEEREDVRKWAEIIRERTAGLPPERKIDVGRRTILEILMTQPTVPLTDDLRLYVALALERLWLPKKEVAKIERERVARSAEGFLEVVKRSKKLTKKLARERGWPTRGGPIATEAIHPALVKGPGGRRFLSPAALAQFLKRERAAKKKPQR
jgi:hypothetical protein